MRRWLVLALAVITLGLTHCDNFECVMRYANSVADIDIKRNVFCPKCSQTLGIPSLW